MLAAMAPLDLKNFCCYRYKLFFSVADAQGDKLERFASAELFSLV
jgi:hypothetical protein